MQEARGREMGEYMGEDVGDNFPKTNKVGRKSQYVSTPTTQGRNHIFVPFVTMSKIFRNS